jgi:hypothetical protein
MVKNPKKSIKKLTPNQELLINLISENIGKIIAGEKARSMYEILINAGYSKSVALQQSLILAPIKDHMDPIVQSLIDHRNKAIAMLDSRIQTAEYGDLVSAIDRLTKNIELLSGRATERVYTLSDEEKKKLDELIA